MEAESISPQVQHEWWMWPWWRVAEYQPKQITLSQAGSYGQSISFSEGLTIPVLSTQTQWLYWIHNCGWDKQLACANTRLVDSTQLHRTFAEMINRSIELSETRAWHHHPGTSDMCGGTRHTPHATQTPQRNPQTLIAKSELWGLRRVLNERFRRADRLSLGQLA